MRIGALLRRSALFHGDTEAIDDGARRVTWRGLERETAALARGLAEAGVKPGERVAILAKNRAEYVAFYFAAAEIGAVLVPLSWRLGPREIEHILADAEATCVVAQEGFGELVDGLSTSLEHVRLRVALDGAPAGWTTYASLVDASGPSGARDGAPDDVCIQMYTSGTTGTPKGAMLTHRNVLSLTGSWLLDMPLLPRADRFLQVTPLFHVGGMLMAMSNAAAGSRLLLQPEFLPGDAARALAGQGVTHALLVPAMLRWLLDEPGVDELDFPDLRLVVYGAAPIPADLLERAMRRLGCGFLQGYGLTETAGLLTTLRPEDHLYEPGAEPPAKLASAGREVLCSRVRVVDADGNDCAPGAVGEVVARGDNVTPGYWRNAEATAEALRGGWFHTGDLATMDAEGFVTIVDRLKDMILVGGENVYPREVEDALAKHSDVAESAVVGAPHDVWGEEVVAFVVETPGAGATDRELIRHCRELLARFKCPTKVELVGELPRNAAGKVLKATLREPYWRGLERRV